MKKICMAGLISLMLLVSGMAGAAETVFFEGEGNIVPSENAVAPFTSSLLTRDVRAGNPVTVNAISQNFPNIELLVTVLDSSGNPVSGLTAADFAVMEQSDKENAGTTQTLTCFEEVAGAAGISFSMAFDLSGSMDMNNRLTDAKSAAIEFLNATQTTDRASLVTFSGCDQGGIAVPVNAVKTDADSNGTPDINAAISGLNIIGMTALYDGIADSVDSIIDEPFPKGVIVFTDGNSNADCHYDINGAVKKAQDAGIPVYTIGLAVDTGSELETNLKLIASETGGYYSAAPTAADMAAIYSAIAQNIRSQYRLCYTTHNPVKDDTTRTVTVAVGTDSGKDTYTVGSEPVVSNQPPVIVHTPVTTGVENEAITITANITDPDDSVARASLFYRTTGTDPDAGYTEVPMTSIGGNNWQVVIPGAAVTPAGLEYYISAWDTNEARANTGTAMIPYPVTVSAAPVNQAPVADAGVDRTVSEGSVIALAGSASDPDGDPITLSWVQTSGPSVTLTNANTTTPQFTAPAVGLSGAELAFRLTVTDSSGASAVDTVKIMVNDALAPKAEFTWSPDSQNAGKPVSFYDNSTPNSSAIVSWAWDFDGLGTSTAANPVFTFDDPGTYTVRLTVTDGAGSTGTVIHTVTISEPPCPGGDCGGGSGGCFVLPVF